MEVLTPHIAQGLRKGERCFCVQKGEVIKRLFNDLRFIGIDAEEEIKRGALLFHTEEEIYFPNGYFEPERMIDKLLESIDQAVKDGFTGFRTAGELSWASRGQHECNQVIGYEKVVEECFPGKPVIAVCQYCVNDFSKDILNMVLEAHKLHIAEKEAHSLHSSLFVGYGSHEAEIVADRFVVDPNYYYVVQRRRPKEVVGWGMARDFDLAAEQAEKLVRTASAAS